MISLFVYNLNDTHRCYFPDISPRILGTVTSLQSKTSVVCILCSETSSGTKSETAAHNIIIAFYGNNFFAINIPFKYEYIVSKGINNIFYLCFFKFYFPFNNLFNF